MLDQFILREIMDLNIHMVSMNINSEETVYPTASSSKEQSKKPNSTDENENPKCRRSLRKRIRPLDNNEPVSIKIQKMENNEIDVEKYYLCNKVKRLPSTLETIFEVPKQQNNMKQYISSRKFKRTIKFEENVTEANRLKIRKRQLKAKKLPSSKTFLNRKKVSMDALLKKLSAISDEEL